MIAVMKSGRRISIYQGEGADDDCFAGEALDPTEKELRMNTHVSCMWDRAKVDRLEPCRPGEPDYGGDGM